MKPPAASTTQLIVSCIASVVDIDWNYFFAFTGIIKCRIIFESKVLPEPYYGFLFIHCDIWVSFVKRGIKVWRFIYWRLFVIFFIKGMPFLLIAIWFLKKITYSYLNKI